MHPRQHKTRQHAIHAVSSAQSSYTWSPAQSECWNGVKLLYNGCLRLCVVIQNPSDMLSPTHPRSPSDLLMVHTLCGSHTMSGADR